MWILLYQSCYDRMLAMGISNGNNKEDIRDIINHTFLDFEEKKIDLVKLKIRRHISLLLLKEK